MAVATFGVPLPGDGADPIQFAYLRPRIYVATTLIAFALPGIARFRFGRWLPSLGRDSFGVYVLNPALLAVLFAAITVPADALTSLLLAGAALVIGQLLARQLRQRLPWLYA